MSICSLPEPMVMPTASRLVVDGTLSLLTMRDVWAKMATAPPGRPIRSFRTMEYALKEGLTFWSQWVSLKSTMDGLCVDRNCLNSVRRVLELRRPFAFHCTIVVVVALFINILVVSESAGLYLLLMLFLAALHGTGLGLVDGGGSLVVLCAGFLVAG